MSDHRLVVALGDRRYRVERPLGDLPNDAGRVSDVTVDSRGHVFVLLRYDPLVDAPGHAGRRTRPRRQARERMGRGPDRGLAHARLHATTTGSTSSTATRTRSSSARRRASASVASAGGIARSSRSIIRPMSRSRRLATSSCRTAMRPARSTVSGAMGARSSRGERGAGTAASSSIRMRSGCLPDGRVVAVDRENERLQVFSADGDAARRLGRLQAAARHLGRRGRQPVRHRSRAVAHACCRPTARWWGAAGRCSMARTASGATRTAICFWRSRIRAGSRDWRPE